MSKQLSAWCNKCGWVGKADPGLSTIEHEGCNYTAVYSTTELKLHDLIEAAERADEMIQKMADIALQIGIAGTSDWDKLAGGPDMFGAQDALRSALLKAKGEAK